MKVVKNRYLAVVMCMAVSSLNALYVGDVAPDFSLSDQDDKARSLSEFKGKYVVLYFYPKDGTRKCTKEACSFRDSSKEFEDRDIVVLGINYDSPKKHRKFIKKHNIKFTLLSDHKKSVAKKYGAKHWWFIPVPKRMTVVIDPNGKIYAIFKHVDVSTHAASILKTIPQ